MKGLLIEDDVDKASKIINYLADHHSNCDMIQKSSYQSGLKELFSTQFDFILLDMSLPTYDQGKETFSGKPKNYGGKDILKEMKRYQKTSKVKVITQYNEFDGGSISMKELDEQLKSKYPNLYFGYIYYNHKQSGWENELDNFINSLGI